MSVSRKVEVKPFSDSYKAYYDRCFSNRINCLEGAFRAGKTVINVFSFANYLEYCRDKIHLVSGASEATARLNVADCDGFGLNAIFRGRCHSGKYENNPCLKIDSKCGKKIVVFVGGGKSDSYKRIQGLSFGSWLSVELANLYISDDEKDFIKMALSRLTQSKDQRVWWDLNPTYPSHRVYTKYLDPYLKLHDAGEFQGGFNFMTCTLFDNLALDEDQRLNALAQFPDEESVDYKRYILGLRAYAEGLIFGMFARNQDMWIVNDMKEFIRGIHPQFVSIGVDFGGNGSNTTFVASLIYNNFSGVCVFADDLIEMGNHEADAQEFHDRFKEFILHVISLSVAPLRYAFGDCADTVMVNEMKKVIRELHLANVASVRDSVKATIKERIDAKKLMIATKRWFVYKDATNVIDSTKTQVWDNREGHKDERLDNGSTDIDTADSEEYSWSAFMKKIIQRG